MVDLFSRLQNGETADEIAKEFTDQLNKAEQEYSDYLKKEEEKAKQQANKNELVLGILQSIALYMTEYHSDNKIIMEEVKRIETLSDKELNEIAQLLDTMLVVPDFFELLV